VDTGTTAALTPIWMVCFTAMGHIPRIQMASLGMDGMDQTTHWNEWRWRSGPRALYRKDFPKPNLCSCSPLNLGST